MLVIEDNEPAAKWLSLINQALNKPLLADSTKCPCTPTDYRTFFSTETSLVSRNSKSASSTSLSFFQKPSLKNVGKNFRTELRRRVKACNCPSDEEKKHKDSFFRCQQACTSENDSTLDNEDGSIQTPPVGSDSTNHKFIYGRFGMPDGLKKG